MYLIDLQELTF